MINVMHLAESILRTQNNLLERLHASIWFYMFSSINHYSSISLYMPTVGLLLALPLLFGLKRWLMSDDMQLGNFAVEIKSVLLLAFGSQLLNWVGLMLSRLQAQYILPAGLLCLVVLPLISLVCRKSYHPKISSAIILLYSLQCGLLSLVCFSQALFLAMGGLFITIAFKRDKPHLLLLAHPVLLFSLAALASFYLDTETLDLSVLVDFWRQILDSDYSSLPEIMAFSAVPTWCALAFTS